jgi:glycosyltransferase involved in cell wall biosynthesis
MKAVLLPNLVEFPAFSMKRYATELEAALRQVASPSWQVDALQVHQSRTVKKLLGGERGDTWGLRAGLFVKYPQAINKAKASHKADVYHVLDQSHASLTRALDADKAVLTCHDIIPFLASKGLVPIPVSRWNAKTYPRRLQDMNRCCHIIADSQSTRNDLIEHGKIAGEKISVIYPGVGDVFHKAPGNATEQRTALRIKHGIPQNAPVVMHLSTPNRYKNTPALLRALGRLKQSSIGPVWFLRLGADFFDDEQELIRELGLGDFVVHAGRGFTDEVLASYYRTADVFAFPSLWEGLGWPPLEAMACGVPVVVSNVASLPEVVGNGGMTVAPTDDAALAEALHTLLSDAALYENMRSRASAHAGKFTWERCARQVLSVYESVAGKAPVRAEAVNAP